MAKEIYDLNRFVVAQGEGVYESAMKEIKGGKKRSHWMWYIFPQLKQLGHSSNSKFYGIEDIDEAKEYLAHPLLGQRLREISQVLCELTGNNAVEIFGDIDAIKLISSMTLFDAVSPNDIFHKVLDKYNDGEKDIKTIDILLKSLIQIDIDESKKQLVVKHRQ